MKKWTPLLLVLFLYLPAKANTFTAASCSVSDVQAAINLASDGDTVQIPDGSCSWTTSISTTKQIWIRAQNYTRTVGGTATRNVTITNNISGSTPMISMTSGNTFSIRITGIAFKEGTGTANHVRVQGTGTKVPIMDDDYIEVTNRFGNNPDAAAIAWGGTTGVTGGVWWNMKVQGVGGGIGGQCCPEGASIVVKSARAWYTASTLGALDTNGDQNFYIEDSSWQNFGQSPDMDDNARVVIRHSTLDGNSGLTHGFTSAFGGRQFEYYNNTITTTTSNRNVASRYFWARAGTGVFTDNTVAYQNQGYGVPTLLDSIVECSAGVSCPNGGPPAYPRSRQVGWSCNPCGGTQGTSTDVSDPVYLWNNCISGHTLPCAGDSTWGTASSFYIQLNRDIFVDSGAKPGYSKFTYPHPLSQNNIPGFIYSNVAPNSSTAGSGAGGAFSSTPDYRIPLEAANITAGSTILLSFAYENQSQTFTVSDNKSNTWTLDVTSSASNGRIMRMYRAVNVAAGTSYVNIHANAGSGFWQGQVAVFYNANTLDASSCNTGTSTSITAGSLTPTVSGDLIFQATYSSTYSLPTPRQTANFTAGSQANITWSLASELLGDGAALQYGVYNSTSAINPTFTQAASDTFISCAVALKANATGSAPSATLRVLHQEHDAMPKNAPNPWKLGLIATAAGAVYISSMENDQISSITSSPVPDVNWSLSGADFVGTNGHNHTTIWCASFNSPPGSVLVTVNRNASTNDGIFMIYDVVGGTCNLDTDSGGQASQQTSIVASLTTCSGCLTPTHQNDIIFANEGQGFCTGTSLVAPSGGTHDSNWFTGNSIDGATQTDENNNWMHFYNGASLSAVTVTWGETCGGTAENYWAGRVAAYQSVSGPPPPAAPAPALFSGLFKLSGLILVFGVLLSTRRRR